jgi:RimJ/RimL family protein N-acetyltransferase
VTVWRDNLLDGQRVTLRPLKPEDAALYPDFFTDVTFEDRRLRFFGPVAHVTDDMIARFTHYDPERAMALIAIDEATGKMLGVVRLHDDPDGKSGEFAVLVRSSLKGHGLGYLLMKHILDYAEEKGLKAMHAQVLTENTTMLKMAEQLGFEVRDELMDRGIKRVMLTFAN